MLKFVLTANLVVIGLAQSLPDEMGQLNISPKGVQNKPAGESFAMHCNQGVGEGAYANFKWIGPQGQEITMDVGSRSSAISTFETKKGSMLTFDKPTPENSGNYTCKALYGNTKQLQTSVKITIFHDITLDDCPRFQQIVKGRDGTIRCNVHGNPVPQLFWRKFRQILEGPRYTLQGSHLNVRNVQESDAGPYEVTASVEATGRIKKEVIAVTVLIPPAIDVFAPISINEGDFRTVYCPASGVPSPLCHWIDFSGRNLSSVPDFKVNPEACTLDFVRALRRHDGNYTCLAKNTVETTSKTARIAVHVPPKIIAFKNVTVDERSTTQLQCEVEGKPAPEISIRKEGDTSNLEHDRSIQFERRTTEYTTTVRMVINSTTRQRAGLYYCRAESSAIHVESTGYVDVHFAPVIRAKENPVHAWQNHDARLFCHVEAIPNATVEWRDADGVMLHDGDHFKIENSVGVSVLYISDQVDRYGRKFACKALNNLGESELVFDVVEARRPTSPGVPKLVHASATTISFVFDQEANDGGMPILEYAVKYWRRGSAQAGRGDVDTKVVSEIVAKPITIAKLLPRTEYAFVFSARSEVGEGPLSAEWAASTTQEAAPERPVVISNLPGSVLSDRVHVQWTIPLDNGKPIEYFKVYYQQVERISPLEVRPVGYKKSLTVDTWTSVGVADLLDLKPATLYQISIEAHNSIGHSEPGITMLQTANDTRFLGFPESSGEAAPKGSIGLPLLITLLALACLVVLVVVDVLCYFHFRMGLLYALRHLICAETSQGAYSKTSSSPAGADASSGTTRCHRPAKCIIE